MGSKLLRRRWVGLLLGMASITTSAACVHTPPPAPRHTGSCWVYDTDIDLEYTGECIDGVVPNRGMVKVAHGWGTAKGSGEYTGWFKEGRKHGQGVFVSGPEDDHPGVRIEGEFNEDRVAKGVTTWPSGARLEAVANAKGGHDAVMTWPNGMRYEGELHSGHRHGFGTLTIPRSQYVAEKRSKLGVWFGDTFVEQGRFEVDILVEATIADRKTGCKVWNASPKPDESVSWTGSCRDGFAEGKGVLSWFDGNTKLKEREEGIFHAGKRGDGPATVTIVGRYTYSGMYKNGKPHGKGTMTWVTSGPGGLKKYTGEFAGGTIYGEGNGEFADGDKYTGRWSNDVPMGETQRNASTQKERERIVSILSEAIGDDATHWSFNKFDYGSVTFDKVKLRHPNRAIASVRVNYTYNRGRQGWVQAEFFPSGTLNCVTFHDFPNTCRDTRVSRSVIAANRTGAFTLHATSPEYEKNQINWRASCTEGGYAWVNKRHDETSYIWGSGGFTGSHAGADYQLTVEQMLRKACKGG